MGLLAGTIDALVYITVALFASRARAIVVGDRLLWVNRGLALIFLAGALYLADFGH